MGHHDIVAVPVVGFGKLRSGPKTVTGFMPAGGLLEVAYVPYHDPVNRSGYQHPPSAVKIANLVSGLRSGRTDLPNGALVNLRTVGPRLAGNETGWELRLDSDCLTVIDGQYMFEALRALTNVHPRWKTLMVPFVCVLGADETQEMELFVTVNTTGGTMSTHIAEARLRPDADPLLVLVRDVAAACPVWTNRVRWPGDPKNETVIKAASFAGSLRKPFKGAVFGKATPEQQKRILCAMWEGISKALPEPFEDPLGYSLQKTLGVATVHNLLEDVLALIRINNQSVFDAGAYAEVFDGLSRLRGENQNGDTVSGSGFWRAGRLGACGAYSSNAGRQVLIGKLRQLLPALRLV